MDEEIELERTYTWFGNLRKYSKTFCQYKMNILKWLSQMRLEKSILLISIKGLQFCTDYVYSPEEQRINSTHYSLIRRSPLIFCHPLPHTTF